MSHLTRDIAFNRIRRGVRGLKKTEDSGGGLDGSVPREVAAGVDMEVGASTPKTLHKIRTLVPSYTLKRCRLT